VASDFPGENIEVRSQTDMWGPFNFDVSSAIPSGTNVNNVTVRSWQRSTETTSDLIESSTVVVLDNVISVRFQCPKDTEGNTIFKGDHIIKFIIELDDSQNAIHTLRFEYVVVED